MSDAGRTRAVTEALEMDWSHSPQASQQHYTTRLNLKPRGEKEMRTTEKTCGAMICKQTSRDWRQWERLNHVGGLCLSRSRLWLIIDSVLLFVQFILAPTTGIHLDFNSLATRVFLWCVVGTSIVERRKLSWFSHVCRHDTLWKITRNSGW